VASQAADLSGVGSAILKKMLPVIAAMVMGALAKRMTGGAGSAPSAPRPAPGGGSLDDLLREILGGGAGGSPRSEEVVRRSRDSFDDALGGGTPSGNAADDLLNSVDKAIRRRR
jgi:hypothetical protein